MWNYGQVGQFIEQYLGGGWGVLLRRRWWRPLAPRTFIQFIIIQHTSLVIIQRRIIASVPPWLPFWRTPCRTPAPWTYTPPRGELRPPWELLFYIIKIEYFRAYVRGRRSMDLDMARLSSSGNTGSLRLKMIIRNTNLKTLDPKTSKSDC